MLLNYFRTAFRYLRRHGGFSLLNIVGLTVGMTAFFLIFLYVNFELSYDSFYSQANRVYRIVSDIKTPEGIRHLNAPPLPTALHMAKYLPEVEAATRISETSGTVMLTRDNDVFDLEDAGIADSSFFRVFDVPFIQGNRMEALANPSSIVLSETAAKRFFGNTKAIGRTLQIGRLKFPATVTAVMKDFPQNSHLQVSLLLPQSIFERMNPAFDSAWNNYTESQYVLLKPGADAAALQAGLPAYLEKMGGASLFRFGQKPTLLLEPVRAIYLYSTRDDAKNGHIGNVYIFSIIGIFIMLIAGVNFINLTTARSVERAKEVGIRKVAGAGRFMLAGQFISESVILSGIACVLAVVLSWALLPLFNQLAGKTVSPGILTHPQYPGILAGVSIFVGIAAGLYPAMVLSSFRPAAVLKGTFRTGSGGVLLRKGLVTGQMTIAIGLMIATGVVYFQLIFMRSQDLGFSREQRLVMNTRNDPGKLAFKQSLAAIPGVSATTMANSVPGMLNTPADCRIRNVHGDMQAIQPVNYLIDYDYFERMGMKIAAGRNFSRIFPADGAQAMIVNETAVRQLGYTSPDQAVGGRFEQGNESGTIIGVVRDFHLRSLQDPIKALTVRIDPSGCDLVCATIDGHRVKETMSAVEAKWKELLPDRPFTYFFLDEFFNRQYRNEEESAGFSCASQSWQYL